MRKSILTLIAILLVPTGVRADQAVARAMAAPEPRTEAPAAWNQQDPADSIYRAAREAMNQREYEQAAERFHEVWNQYARSTYAPDAMYWEAYNRYRLGGTEELEHALSLLELQGRRYPEASTRQEGDAPALATRIRGMLARRGNESAAAEIVAVANEMAGMGSSIAAEASEQAARLAEQVAAHSDQIAEMAEQAARRGLAIAGMRADTDDIPQECREQAETQLAALNALIQMNADRAMPVLRRVMERRDPCSVVLRRRAVFLIADKEAPESLDILLAAANDDPDLEVRRQAVYWLSEVDDPRAVDALARFVRESDDNQTRERAIFALSQHSSPRAMEVVREVAQDESMPTRLRDRAIFWLGEEGTPEDIEALKQLFDGIDNETLAERILFSVGQTGRQEDARWLLSVATDANRPTELRRKAIFWAAEAGISAAELGRLYDQLQDPELKERVIFGLSESDDPAAIDRLVEIARTETDSRLRSRAIFWLGNSNDERAADVLMEILANPGGGGGEGGGNGGGR